MSVDIRIGDSRALILDIPDGSINCCVTSPPYFGLRDYGCDGQVGLEDTPDQFIAEMLSLFREVRRVLRDDGTLWLNIGDSYASIGGGYNDEGSRGKASVISPKTQRAVLKGRNRNGHEGIKQKDLIGIPWMLAFALRADGWYLRQDIIWSKPNPMPESVQDRCTKAHEYLFLLSKRPKYYYDLDAVAEPVAATSVARLAQNVDAQTGSDRVPGKTNGPMKAVGRGGKNAFRGQGANRPNETGQANRDNRNMQDVGAGLTRNKRSVWEVATQPFSGAHFATFPPALIEPCILAGCPVGGTVLDPFGGAGTTGLVADRLQRNSILLELSPEYAAMARRRIDGDRGGLLDAMESAA